MQPCQSTALKIKYNNNKQNIAAHCMNYVIHVDKTHTYKFL